MLLQGLEVNCAIQFFLPIFDLPRNNGNCRVSRQWPTIRVKQPKPAQAQKWLYWDHLRGSEIHSDGVVGYWSNLRICSSSQPLLKNRRNIGGSTVWSQKCQFSNTFINIFGFLYGTTQKSTWNRGYFSYVKSAPLDISKFNQYIAYFNILMLKRPCLVCLPVAALPRMRLKFQKL